MHGVHPGGNDVKTNDNMIIMLIPDNDNDNSNIDNDNSNSNSANRNNENDNHNVYDNSKNE